MEKFITDKGNGIIEFVRFHHGKDVRTRVNSFLRVDIKKYFDIHDIDIEMYVLEWCRDKSSKVIEMQISPVMMNLEDVSDMNVGDMVNEYTSEDNASYKEHLLLLLSLL